MGKTIGLLMAKASNEDIDGGFDLAHIFEAIGKGEYPSWFATPEDREAAENAGGIPTHFDESNVDHLQHLHSQLTGLYERRRGFSLFRVVMGMHVILRNDILDPDVDHLALHPKFAANNKLLRDALAALVGSGDVTELRSMELAMRQLPAPDADKAVTINAIHALIATAPSLTESPEVAHA
jgi:hypothetical protein